MDSFHRAFPACFPRLPAASVWPWLLDHDDCCRGLLLADPTLEHPERLGQFSPRERPGGLAGQSRCALTGAAFVYRDAIRASPGLLVLRVAGSNGRPPSVERSGSGCRLPLVDVGPDVHGVLAFQPEDRR